MEQEKNRSAVYPIFVMSLCAFFLFYKYILQNYPSIITNQLMSEFQLTAAGLGGLSATFFYTYVVTQLFVGVILDRYSARWITSSAVFCCALGVFMFSEMHNVLGAGLSRALMGVGVSFATVAYMKLASTWFPPRRYALITGFLATAAMTGAVFGQAPLSWIVHHLGWRESLYYVGIVGFILTLLFAIFVHDSPRLLHSKQVMQQVHVSFKEIMQVFKNKQNWLLTFYAGLACSPIAVFGGLWGNPFLQEAYTLDKTTAASLVSLVFVGLGVGSPILGMLSDRIGNRRHVMLYSTLTSCIAISLVVYVHPMPIVLLGTLLFTFGFALGAFPIAFAIGKELNNIKLTATVIAMINASDAFLDMLTEPGIGKLLDLGWDGKIVDGVHYFSLHSYHIALSVLPLYLIVATALLVWVKDGLK